MCKKITSQLVVTMVTILFQYEPGAFTSFIEDCVIKFPNPLNQSCLPLQKLISTLLKIFSYTGVGSVPCTVFGM